MKIHKFVCHSCGNIKYLNPTYDLEEIKMIQALSGRGDITKDMPTLWCENHKARYPNPLSYHGMVNSQEEVV